METSPDTVRNLEASLTCEAERYLLLQHIKRLIDCEKGQPSLANNQEASRVLTELIKEEVNLVHGNYELLNDTRKINQSTGEMLATEAAEAARLSEELYPKCIDCARQEGFEEVATWFETLRRNKKSQASRLKKLVSLLSRS